MTRRRPAAVSPPPGRADQKSGVAALAARLLAAHQARDLAEARRKAAQQLGLSDRRRLPGDDEIEAALAAHRALFDPQHPARLQDLRQKALYLMRLLRDFRPALHGPVLSGSAGAHAAIELLLFSDDPKALEFFLIDRQIDYRHQTPPGAHYPELALDFDGTPVHLQLRPGVAERQHTHQLPRADIAALEKLLA